MAFLIDTNVLVYAFDPRFPGRQAAARTLLREGLAAENLRIPHQALLEFVAVVRRPLRPGGTVLLTPAETLREVEELLLLYPVLYPDEPLFRLALRAAAAFGLSWFDAHLLAYAERYNLDLFYSEDFEHGRYYGRVRIVNPFRKAQAPQR